MTPTKSSRRQERSGRARLVAIVAAATVLGVLLLKRNSTSHADAHAPHASQRHAHDHDHDHGLPDAHAMPPVPEGGWQTDEPLRLGMTRIRSAVEPVIQGHLENRLTAADATALTIAINTQFAYMAEHCQLAPDADAALHLVVVHLLQASGDLERDPDAHDPIVTIIHALETYAASFQHDGWEPIAMNH